MAKRPTTVETLRHAEATRKNIPTAELESVMRADEKSPVQVAYERRNRDLDPQSFQETIFGTTLGLVASLRPRPMLSRRR